VPKLPASTRREGAGVRLAEERFEPKPGLVVAGKYRVDRIIGEGGMGVVAAATHVELDQHVAIKFLLPDAMRSEEAVERFLREAKVAAKVKNEHVARVSDVGKTEPEGVPYIVMEYLEGSDLGALIAEQGKLPVDEVCEIGLQACEALAEVHAAGIVHRDLKPSNLFITRRSDESPCVKLLDFGISKFNVHPDDERVDPALTATATIMGSPSYMSPEQLRSTKEVDARTDVWALGAVLYEAVTGKPAFRGETVPQVCFMIGSEEPAPPSSVRADTPPELERIILACLDKKAETRATLVDLARVLVEYAPERARVSLERVEAVLGGGPPRKRDVSSPVVVGRASKAAISSAEVVRPPPPPEHARTQASWDEDQRRQPKRSAERRGGGGALALLVVVVLGVFGVGVFTGRIDLSSLTGQAASATSAMSKGIASATAAVESALPSSLPSAIPALPLPSSLPPLPSSIPELPSAIPSSIPFPDFGFDTDAGDGTDEDDEAADAAPAPSSTASPSPAPVRVAPRPAPAKHPRPRHWVNKTVHKRR
jgi:serine/threonine-protein kinase